MVERFVTAVLAVYVFYTLVFGPLMLAEVRFGRSKMPLRDRFRGMMFWAFLIPLDILLYYFAGQIREASGIDPLVTFKFDPGSAILAAIAAALASDFVFYWFHRFQHRFLWRFHSVHHSIENMSATNSYHHWLDPLWTVTLVALPLSFFAVSTVEQAAWLAILLRAYPYYLHSPVKAHVGPLSRWVVDNRFHRIHHSRSPEHYDRNFGALTTLWDRMFGTAYFPGKNEWPDVGIAAHHEPKTLFQWFKAKDRSRGRGDGNSHKPCNDIRNEGGKLVNSVGPNA